MHRRLIPHFSAFSLLLGVLFLAASFTPSLIPRTSMMQGVLGGVVMALGYLAGRILELLWNAADMPVLHGGPRRVGFRLLWAMALALLAWSLWYGQTWQNDLRQRMGVEPVQDAHILQVLLITAVAFAVLFLVGHIGFGRVCAASIGRAIRSRSSCRGATLRFRASGIAGFSSWPSSSSS